MDKYLNTSNTFNEVAEAYWKKFKDFKPYEPTYDWFLNHLPNGDIDLLEIACGPGNVSRYLLEKNNEINLTGIDVAPNMIHLAKQHNPNSEFSVLDCREIKSLNRSFNAIMCGFCIPYISWIDTQELICNMASMLQTNGLLYLSNTKGSKSDEGYKGSKSSSGSVYVHFHDSDEILNCLRNNKFKVIGQKSVSHIHNDLETIDQFFLARLIA